MFNVIGILFLILYSTYSDLLNPHAIPILDDELALLEGPSPKKSFIPRLLADGSDKQEDPTSTKNLIVYYSFDSQAPGSSRIKDESGYDNNGIVDVGGMLIEMPGSTCGVASYLWDQSVKISFSTPDGAPKEGVSISLWLKMLVNDGERIIFTARGRRFGMMTIKFIGKTVFFTYKYCRNCSTLFELAAETSISNDWAHLAATYNATTGIAQIFINGIPLNRTWNKNFGPFQYWGNDVRVGGFQGRSVKGFVDDIRIYNYALTSSEIQLLAMSCCFHSCKADKSNKQVKEEEAFESDNYKDQNPSARSKTLYSSD